MNTTWLTNGSKTFDVPLGGPLYKRLLSEGYEECDPPIPGAPGSPDGSEHQEEPDGSDASLEVATPPAKKAKG